MRNRALDIIYYSLTFATVIRLAVAGIMFWAAVEVDTMFLRLLISVIVATQIVLTIRRVILVRKILTRLDKDAP